MAHLSVLAVRDPADIERLAVLAAEIWQAYFPPLIGQDQVDYMVARFQSVPALTRQLAEGFVYALLLADGEPAGYFGLRADPDGRLFLSKLYIAAAYRGRGLGRWALERIRDEARTRGCHAIHLTCNRHNTASIAAYQHLGFHLTGTVVTDIGGGFVMDDVTMESPLD